jgi:Flp pilus assembly protein TadG
MPRRSSIYSRFLASRRGVAAIEFGFLFPVLLLLLLAGIDAGRAVAISMKVRTAAYAIDSMANTYLFIYDTDMQDILNAASKVLAPYSSPAPALRLSQIKIASGGQTTVVWSDQQNSTAYAQGSAITIPANFTTTSAPNNTCKSYPCYLLLAEVNYTYTPMFGHFITGPITLSDTVYITPRTVTCVQRNGNIPPSC